ncbi:hypothetical protein ASPFODRAFT_330930 [Aspergillus luchuensis CBS 106.47]|uniref:Uncharacterized protein n=1 Tax=Aspergillus luchuensis (strain CBS 106.47) TaxID=1137211 RepID=A0A1M3T7R5_ASPLC|nr:hypothetical protein ASPFODRAFT_330930 [Aspergillus luchuensis CBS 106.47]
MRRRPLLANDMISVALVFLLHVMEVHDTFHPSFFFSFHVQYWRFARLNNGKLASQGGLAGYHGLLVRIAYDICCPVLYVVVHLIRCGFVLMWFGVYI